MNVFVHRPGIVSNLLEDFNLPYVGWGRDEPRQPDVDIRENEDHFVLEADLPGLTEKDIDIHIDNSRLTIKANLEQEKKEEKEKYLLQERRSSSFSRSFVLSEKVDTEKVEASFKNGILRIVAPKKERERAKKIAIRAA